MKKKTINAIIAKKMNNWLESIEDDVLRYNVKRGIIVTGGCITSMLLNEPVNDFDVYIKDKATLKALSEYYCNNFNAKNKDKANHLGRPLHAWVLDGQDVEEWKAGIKTLASFAYDYPAFTYEQVMSYQPTEGNSNKAAFWKVSNMLTNVVPDRIKIMINSDGIAEDGDNKADVAEYDINQYLDALGDGETIKAEVVEEPKETKYQPIFLSTNAITLSGGVQVIVRFYGTPEEIHKNYDFVHATNYWTFDTGCVLNQPALEAILNKELVYVGSKYPVCSLIRSRKFIKRGWQINAGQFVKISFQISELDLTDINVLEDQLVGVDSIYFLNFIRTLKEKSVGDKDFHLSKEYLTTVIDKIFG
jgi:hypothetical protein